MARGSPGYASAISGRGTGLNTGPEWMSSTGANHAWKLGCAAETDGSSGSVVRLKQSAGRQGTETQGSTLRRLRRALGVGGERGRETNWGGEVQKGLGLW